ncbi:hypothetical protein B5M09_004146, partial [Aphanomyces astaci]
HEFHEGPICDVVCHPKQPVMISCAQDGTARLLQLQGKRQLAVFVHGVTESNRGTVADDEGGAVSSVECAGFCNTLNWAATGDLGGELRIWDLATYQEMILGAEFVVRQGVTSDLVTASEDETVRIFTLN